MSRSKPFRPLTWILRWEEVGTINVTEDGRVWIGADLNGNMVAQRSLLTMLDAKPSRREAVRKAAIEREKRG